MQTCIKVLHATSYVLVLFLVVVVQVFCATLCPDDVKSGLQNLKRKYIFCKYNMLTFSGTMRFRLFQRFSIEKTSTFFIVGMT